MKSIYKTNGYKNRKHYLHCLSIEYNIPITTVWAIAGVLGQNEDFDGLLNELEDFATYCC